MNTSFRLELIRFILLGLYEFVKKGDPPVMGLMKLTGEVTAEALKRPRKKLPGEETAHRLPGTD